MKRSSAALIGFGILSLLLGAAAAWPGAGAPPVGMTCLYALLIYVPLIVFFLVLPKWLKLPMQIFVAMVAGALAGWLFKMVGQEAFVADYLNIFGALFILLLKVVIIPLIFVSIVCGVAGIGDPRKLGSVGFKALAFYVCTTCLAVFIGLLCVNIIKPGVGVGGVPERMEAAAEQKQAQKDAPLSLGQKIQKKALPTVVHNPIMDGQNPLRIIFVAILLGAALASLGKAGEGALKTFRSLDKAFVTLVLWIMALAPIGVYALMAKAIATLGIDYIASLAVYVLTVVTGLGLHFLVLVFVVLVVFARISPMRYLRGMLPALELSFSTSSSAATLPVTIDCAHRRVGADENICNFMLPIGATVNMDGTALYQAVAVVFISQVLGVELSMAEQFTVFLTAIMVSIGTAGIPGGSVALMYLVLEPIGIDAQYVGLIIGVDRFLDMSRTLINITGDSVGAVVVSRSEGLIKEPQLDDEA